MIGSDGCSLYWSAWRWRDGRISGGRSTGRDKEEQAGNDPVDVPPESSRGGCCSPLDFLVTYLLSFLRPHLSQEEHATQALNYTTTPIPAPRSARRNAMDSMAYPALS